MIPFYESVEKFHKSVTETIGIRIFEAWPLFVAGLLLIFNAYIWMQDTATFALSLALFLAPVWLPFLLVGSAIELWFIYKRSEFLAEQKYVLLEIRPPRSLVKTPLAMETFLTTIHITGGEGNWWVKLMGSTRPSFSLEIASFEGQVHFYIWTRARFRSIVESQLYAQYPGLQITEAVDYTRLISATPEEWMIWGCDYFQKGPDPLPMKTYVEFGLDKVQKEPEQIDPLVTIIEMLSSIGKGEYMWTQLVIRAHKGEKYDKLTADGKAHTWRDEAKALIKKIRDETRDVLTDPTTGKESLGFPNPTKGQIEMMSAIERNISKPAFDVGGRAIYIANPKNFNPANVTQLVSLYKPLNNENWNYIESVGWLKTFDDYPWEIEANKARKDKYRRHLVEVFRRRQFFYPPFYKGSLSPKKTMVMSTEEIATIYHIPSAAIESPGLVRVRSTTGQAPENLPV